MGIITSLVFGGPKAPIKNCWHRLKNLIINNFRGLIGFLVPLIVLPPLGIKNEHHVTVQCMWMWMFWSFLWQPVNVPVTGLIPLFILPLTCVVNSDDVCNCYFTENIALFILGGMVVLLLNNSGFDHRIILKIICFGDAPLTPLKLFIRVNICAYVMSIFSNKLLVTSFITQLLSRGIGRQEKLFDADERKDKEEGPDPSATPEMKPIKTPDADLTSPKEDEKFRAIIMNSVQTSSSIGGIAIMHSSFSTLTMRAIYDGATKDNMDTFNYLQYSCIAFPISFVMFLFNFIFHLILMIREKKNVQINMVRLKDSFKEHEAALPKPFTLHEFYTLFFLAFALALFFTRFAGAWWDGWGPLVDEKGNVRDATVAAMFVIALHSLPKGFSFITLFRAKLTSDLPPVKPESGIMFWRFMNKNTNYGYMFLIGSGVALSLAAQKSGLDVIIAEHFGNFLVGHSWLICSLIVCLLTTILCNVMTSVAACVIFLPFVLCAYTHTTNAEANEHMAHAALAVGIGSSLGLMWPFLYTPAYFTYYVGKVSWRKMAIYSLVSVIICTIILWLGITFYAPIIIAPFKPEIPEAPTPPPEL